MLCHRRSRRALSRLIWSYPETVLGPFQAAYFRPTLLILVLHLGPFQAAHFGPTLTKDILKFYEFISRIDQSWIHINTDKL